ncbi:MAG: helix-turn-helix transcriptional regulator [Hydrogenophilales bacterium]|nr:helix-turn-helix transcriptional regulator [Hydrogenophilales bacterium]
MPIPRKSRQTPQLSALRRASGLNQTEFWRKIGITQSCGSRYEAGERRLPPPVAYLIDLIYVRGIDITKLHGDDMPILHYLQQHQSELYARLRQNMASARQIIE